VTAVPWYLGNNGLRTFSCQNYPEDGDSNFLRIFGTHLRIYCAAENVGLCSTVAWHAALRDGRVLGPSDYSRCYYYFCYYYYYYYY